MKKEDKELIEDKESGIFVQDISKDTFKGTWPFTCDAGTLINNNSAILFVTKNCKAYSINGLAQSRFKKFKILKKYKRFYSRKNIHRRSDNGFFVSLSDIIMYALKMNPNYNK